MSERYTYSYDSWGRPLTVTHRPDTLPAVVLHAYGYDAAGRLAGDGRNGDADLQTNHYDPYGESLPDGSAVDSGNRQLASHQAPNAGTELNYLLKNLILGSRRETVKYLSK